MESIKIMQNDKILAHHTTDSYLSHYGQSVWVIEEDSPAPGIAVWEQGEVKHQIEILELKAGWLLCRQPDGFLIGIIWSDGSYYAGIIVDQKETPLREMAPGAYVRGAIQFDPTNPEDLGAII